MPPSKLYTSLVFGAGGVASVLQEHPNDREIAIVLPHRCGQRCATAHVKRVHVGQRSSVKPRQQRGRIIGALRQPV